MLVFMPSGGHNNKYTPEAAATVLRMMAEGHIQKDIANALGIGVTTLADWRVRDPLFDRECIRAQDIGFELDADSLKTIADEYLDVQRGKLKSENIKWLLSRRAAFKYGDRLDLNVNQTVDINAALLEARGRAIPASFQRISDSLQIAEVKAPSTNESTGSQSVATDSPTETKDAEANDPDDIFS